MMQVPTNGRLPKHSESQEFPEFVVVRNIVDAKLIV